MPITNYLAIPWTAWHCAVYIHHCAEGWKGFTGVIYEGYVGYVLRWSPRFRRWIRTTGVHQEWGLRKGEKMKKNSQAAAQCRSMVESFSPGEKKRRKSRNPQVRLIIHRVSRRFQPPATGEIEGWERSAGGATYQNF